MKSIIYMILLLLFAGMGIDAKAQGANSVKPSSAPMKTPTVKKPRALRAEFGIGLRLFTDGWGIYAERGKLKSNDKYPDLFHNVSFWQIEFAERKDPAQIKRTNTLAAYSNDKPTPFVYGKVNNLYALKLGYGGRKMIAGKPEQGTVSVHWMYLGGLSLGLLKPYYIDAYVVDNTGSLVLESVKYSDKNKDAFLYKPNIVGSSGFSKGIGETKIVPGLQLKTALHFDFAASKYRVLAIETGANIEYYFSTVQIMANKDPKSFFLSGYVSFQFGKRW